MLVIQGQHRRARLAQPASARYPASAGCVRGRDRCGQGRFCRSLGGVEERGLSVPGCSMTDNRLLEVPDAPALLHTGPVRCRATKLPVLKGLVVVVALVSSGDEAHRRRSTLLRRCEQPCGQTLGEPSVPVHSSTLCTCRWSVLWIKCWVFHRYQWLSTGWLWTVDALSWSVPRFVTSRAGKLSTVWGQPVNRCEVGVRGPPAVCRAFTDDWRHALAGRVQAQRTGRYSPLWRTLCMNQAGAAGKPTQPRPSSFAARRMREVSSVI